MQLTDMLKPTYTFPHQEKMGGLIDQFSHHHFFPTIFQLYDFMIIVIFSAPNSAFF